jgi:hypothetical protein
VPDLPIFPFVPVADSFQIAKEALFPHDDTLRLDRRELAAHCFHAIQGIETDDEWQAALAHIRATFADDPASRDWFDRKFGNLPIFRPPPVQLRATELGFDGDFLHLSADAFGVSDVHGAARLCATILGCQGGPFRYGLAPQSRLQANLGAARDQVERLRAELAEARAEAARAVAECDRYRSRLPHRIVERAYELFARRLAAVPQ